MPRFAILTHDHPFLHWDFLLEQGESCRTWRLMQRPDTTRFIPAEAIADHRLVYLDYEGPVNGNRGHVTRWDFGTFEYQFDQTDKVIVLLHGGQIRGQVTLFRSDDGSWQWQHEQE